MADHQIKQPFGKQLIAGDDWSWKISLDRYPPDQYTLKYFFRGPGGTESSLDLTGTSDLSGTEFLMAAASAQTSVLMKGVYVWQMCVFNTLSAGPWKPATAYTIGQQVYDGECIQQCSTAGTSDANPPTWNDTLNATTAEASPSTLVWTCLGPGVRKELDRGQVEILPDISSETAPVDGRSWVKKSLDAVRCVIEGRAGRVERQYMIAGRELQLMTPADLMKWEGHLTARYNRELIESGQLSPSYNQVRVAFGDPNDPVLERLWKNFPGNSQ
jgi:hypothetical protein